MLLCELSVCVIIIALFIGILVICAALFVYLCNSYFFISRYLRAVFCFVCDLRYLSSACCFVGLSL